MIHLPKGSSLNEQDLANLRDIFKMMVPMVQQLVELELEKRVKVSKIDALVSSGKLTAKQASVAQLVLKGMSNEEIGTQLNIAYKTVKFHKTNIFKAFGVKRLPEFLSKAV